MIRIYIVMIIGAVCAGAYFAGYRVGRANAMAECNKNANRQLIQSIKQMGKVNEKTLHTTGRDIRRVLREKYTIAE